MKTIVISLLVLSVSSLVAGKNGGINCGICTAVVGIMEQLIEFRNSSVAEEIETLCDLFPQPVYSPCKEAVEYLGPILIKLIIARNGPDVVCHALNFCYTEQGAPTCHSFKAPAENIDLPFKVRILNAKQLIREDLKNLPDPMVICDLPGIKYLCEWIDRIWTNRTPVIDLDGDGFSPSTLFRGSTWRGKDCLDFVSKVHPGANPIAGDVYTDSNCNGIYGVDNVTFASYEDEFCSQSQPRGIAAIGDSICAHFSFPPVWLDATKLNKDLFKHLGLVVEDESDWPMLGSFTGHGTNDWKEIIQGPIDSIYERLKARNRCNHRDYQNIAINGEDSFNVHNVMKTFSRDQKNDRPLIVFIVLVGNDVCQGKSQDLSKMTTPEEMYNNTLETLAYLDTRLPKGSSVSILGLADGRPLYEAMHARNHPIANYWKDFTYRDFYEYLLCMGISPCPAWLNSNDTARNLAAKRVVEINKVLKDIGNKRAGMYKNFELYYLDDPIGRVLRDWESQGGKPWELVEPSDGFHSNQIGQALTAKAVWEELESRAPEILGPINSHNDQIQKIFGDQGGY